MKSIFIIALFLFSQITLQAQVSRSSPLFVELKKNDSLLFNLGFNTCDIKQFEDLVSENFEFYHDEAGITSSKAAFITSVRDGICKLPYKPKRVLTESSLQVYPLEKNKVLYGAIQSGEHQFFAIEKDGSEHLTSTANFTHVWLKENGAWKLSRALSYNHELPDSAETVNESLLFKDRSETEKWLKKKRIPTLGIGYIENGKIQELTVYGKDENGIAYPKNTIFNVASLTKPVAAMVVLTLINSGKWNLDEPICKYWTDPDVADDPNSKKLTTRHILSHRSGFPNWRRKLPGKKLIFEFPPGTRYQYSGEGFEYLRKALENKFGKPLDVLANELIFRPLEMKDTRFFWDSTVDEARFALWHKGDRSLYETYKNTSPNAADDLLTTVEDYTKFVLYVMNGAGLKKDLYTQMISEQTRIKQRKYFGLSWWVDENVKDGENVLIHGGDDIGVHTIAFILPQSKQGLLIFTNCDNGTDIFIPAIQHYLGSAAQQIIDIETK